MKLNRVLMVAALSGGLLLAGCGDDAMQGGSAETGSPEGAVMAGVNALRDNDLGAFLEVTIPQEQLNKMRAEYAENMQEPVSPSDAAQFEAQMAMLTGPDAEDTLMAQIEPQITQMAAQLPFMIGMVRGMALGQIQENPDMEDEQREKAQQIVGAVFDWAESADLGNLDKARDAVGIVTAAARDLDLSTMEEVRALSFDDAMDKGGMALGAAKDVLDVYGLSVNDMLDSFEAETVADRGDEADVRVSFDFLGTEHSVDGKMVKRDDRWFSKGAMENASEFASSGTGSTGGG